MKRSRAAGGVGQVARIGEGVRERHHLGRVGARDGGLQRLVEVEPLRRRGPLAPASSRARLPSSARSRGPMAHRGPVSRLSRSALAVRSCSSASVETTSETSGSRSSPDRPTISTGISARDSASKTSAAWLLSRVSTPISRHCGSLIAGVAVGHLAREPLQLLVVRRMDAPRARPRRPPSAAGGAGRSAGSRGRAARPTGWRPRGCGVGAAVRRQGQSGHVRAAVGGGEVVAEAEDVGDRRAAPAVDGLVRVADRRHRVAPAVLRVGPENRWASIRACATEVSWYSSSITTR